MSRRVVPLRRPLLRIGSDSAVAEEYVRRVIREGAKTSLECEMVNDILRDWLRIKTETAPEGAA